MICERCNDMRASWDLIHLFVRIKRNRINIRTFLQSPKYLPQKVNNKSLNLLVKKAIQKSLSHLNKFQKTLLINTANTYNTSQQPYCQRRVLIPQPVLARLVDACSAALPVERCQVVFYKYYLSRYQDRIRDVGVLSVCLIKEYNIKYCPRLSHNIKKKNTFQDICVPSNPCSNCLLDFD